MIRIVVIYDSHGEQTAKLAQALAEGVGENTMLARVPAVPGLAPALGPGLTEQAHPVGATAMLAFLAHTGGLWLNRGLAARPATVFVSAGSGGKAEAALGALWSVLASHGMILVPGMPQAAQGPGGAPTGPVLVAGHAEAARCRKARGAPKSGIWRGNPLSQYVVTKVPVASVRVV